LQRKKRQPLIACWQNEPNSLYYFRWASLRRQS